MNEEMSIFSIELDPFKQVAGSLALALVFILVLSLLNFVIPIEGNISYLSLSAFFLFFILVNCLFSFSSTSYIKYQLRSIVAMFVLTGANLLLGFLFTGKTVFEVGSYSDIYIVLIICFFVFTGIISLVITVVEWSKKHKSKIQKRYEDQ